MTFRMTSTDRDRLRHQALETGMSQQQLFELRMFGAAKPRRRDGRPRKARHPGQEVLPHSA